MARIRCFVFSAAAALVVAACDGNAPANNAKVADTAAVTPPAAPAIDEFVKLETSAYQAWKSRDAKFWDTFLSDRFVGYGVSGKLDKASATTEYTGADCDIRNFALSDEQMKMLGNDAVLLTHKTTVDGTCRGQKVPANSWAAGVYVRDGDNWRGAFHAEAPIVDPAAAPAEPAGKMDAPVAGEAKAADGDAGTETLLAVEKAVWEAWREHDARKIEALTAADISFINIFGTHFANKADAMKDWTGTGCDVKSVSVTDGFASALSPTVEMLTRKGTADGTCGGQKIGTVTIWGVSIYVKDGDAWKFAFAMNSPG